jgi:hypothetical protein
MTKKCVVVVVLDICNAKALLGELPKMESDSTGLIVFTACTEVEEARNVFVHGSDISYGVLTCHLLRQIFINEPMTYDELFTAAEIDVNNLCQRMVKEGYVGAQHIGIQVTHANLVHRKFAC